VYVYLPVTAPAPLRIQPSYSGQEPKSIENRKERRGITKGNSREFYLRMRGLRRRAWVHFPHISSFLTDTTAARSMTATPPDPSPSVPQSAESLYCALRRYRSSRTQVSLWPSFGGVSRSMNLQISVKVCVKMLTRPSLSGRFDSL
jgi:hypothetical protein